MLAGNRYFHITVVEQRPMQRAGFGLEVCSPECPLNGDLPEADGTEE
jgi:hypothetical protein